MGEEREGWLEIDLEMDLIELGDRWPVSEKDMATVTLGFWFDVLCSWW